jgi:hypothetical protein
MKESLVDFQKQEVEPHQPVQIPNAAVFEVTSCGGR